MEAEAETIHLDTLNSNKPNETSITVDTQNNDSQVHISAQQRQEFETALRERLPRSYNSYTSLNDKDKADVIDSYFSSKKNLLIAIKRLYKLHFKH
ncbi:MAG: hypothetical protein OEY11_05340 [Gammaproteobacteria bacterium]|nr:hypothetical protein [Gammaproteobacteria bacterium]